MFTVTRLANHRAVIKGNDADGNEGSQLVDTTQWDELKADENTRTAQDVFDAAAEEFLRPLTEALDDLELARARASAKDPVSYIEIAPAVTAVPGSPAQRVALSHDSQLLRLVESDQSRLIWVNDQLEILEVEVEVAVESANTADAIQQVLIEG